MAINKDDLNYQKSSYISSHPCLLDVTIFSQHTASKLFPSQILKRSWMTQTSVSQPRFCSTQEFHQWHPMVLSDCYWPANKLTLHPKSHRDDQKTPLILNFLDALLNSLGKSFCWYSPIIITGLRVNSWNLNNVQDNPIQWNFFYCKIELSECNRDNMENLKTKDKMKLWERLDEYQ